MKSADLTAPRIAVLTPYYLPAYRGGGPIRSIAAMVEQHSPRLRFWVLTSDRDWGATEPLPVATDEWTTVGGAQVRYLAPRHRPIRLLSQLRRLKPDVLYLNGLFPAVWSILPSALVAAGALPAGSLLIAPRGELGSGALALKPAKKELFLRVARLLGIYRHAYWHASTSQEADEIRAVFPKAVVLVHANETLLPDRAARAAVPQDGPLRIVFASRVTPKKGLDVLLRALERVPEPVTLDIYGQRDPSDRAYDDECVRVAATLAAAAPQHRVSFHGPVPPQRLSEVFAEHDVLALPTAHENFGHVIPEALATGCPVLLPDTTPWTGLIRRHRAGAVVESRDPAAWGRALSRLAGRDAADRSLGRARAADAFDVWAADRSTRSVFDLLFEEQERRGRAGAPGAARRTTRQRG